jgi:hypothetical protein
MRKSQLALQQINTCLMPSQHIQPKQQIYILPFHDCKGAIQFRVAYLDLRLMYAAEDTRGADAAGNAAEALVDQVG